MPSETLERTGVDEESHRITPKTVAERWDDLPEKVRQRIDDAFLNSNGHDLLSGYIADAAQPTIRILQGFREWTHQLWEHRKAAMKKWEKQQ